MCRICFLEGPKDVDGYFSLTADIVEIGFVSKCQVGVESIDDEAKVFVVIVHVREPKFAIVDEGCGVGGMEECGVGE